MVEKWTIKAGWWDAVLALRDFRRSTKQNTKEKKFLRTLSHSTNSHSPVNLFPSDLCAIWIYWPSSFFTKTAADLSKLSAGSSSTIQNHLIIQACNCKNHEWLKLTEIFSFTNQPPLDYTRFFYNHLTQFPTILFSTILAFPYLIYHRFRRKMDDAYKESLSE